MHPLFNFNFVPDNLFNINRYSMFIKQLYTGCLSEAAYYIESEGEVAIIDPLRDIDEYINLRKKGMRASSMFLRPISMLIS